MCVSSRGLLLELLYSSYKGIGDSVREKGGVWGGGDVGVERVRLGLLVGWVRGVRGVGGSLR